ncbi:hypothetical protein [Streptomyces albus]|uniref:hypothetical protein n=1 Tax=Streptomyces albus TaxID=1888 RepID=UPI0005695C1E|nr:hypothetical protein [Streptomyces albus]
MAAVAWLLIPVVAAVAAGVWARWAARKRKTGDVAELAGYARFREAMERPGSVPGPAASSPGTVPGSDAA